MEKGYYLSCASGIGNATGANFLLKTPEMLILVDCGLIQGSEYAMEENRARFSYEPKDAAYLLITHAHMDHIGRIPKLVKDGFKGIIYSTEETKELAFLMLEDAQALIAREAKESNREALYEKSDITAAMALWQTIPYHRQFALSERISLYFKDAGHILGSSIIEVSISSPAGDSTKIAFTGDLGNSPTPLLRDTEYVTDADYMVMESVYGDRNHEPKDVRDARLKFILSRALSENGTVIIPAFSLERTQVILFEINNLIESKQIPQVPIFMDSPLATRVTEIYRLHIDEFNEKTKAQIKAGDDIFSFPGLKVVRSPEESARVDATAGAKIIIAGSGMSVGGRVLQHEKFFLSDPKATILLVGYQVPGSLGRKIEEQARSVVVDGTYVNIKARIEKIGGYSSHKDSDHLVEFVSHAAPRLKQVFVAMGENKSSSFFAQRLRDELDVNAIVPEKDREYQL